MTNTDNNLQLLIQTPVQDGSGRPLTLQAKYVWFLIHQTLKDNAANNIYKPPAIKDIATLTGLTRTGVHNIIKALKKAGLMKFSSFAKTGPTTFEYVADPLQVIQNNIQTTSTTQEQSNENDI
jgi:hypothetical protein